MAASLARPVIPPAHRSADGLRSVVGISIAGKAAELVTLVALAVLVPRVLGPADFGRFSVALTVVTIASVAMMLGGPTLLARYVPTAAPAQRAALARALTARLALGRAAQFAAVAVVAALLAVVGPSAFPADLTALVVLALGLSVVATLALQAGLALGRTAAWSARYPLQNAVLVVAVLVLYPLGGVTAAVGAITLSCAVSVGLGAVLAGSSLRGPGTAVALPAGAMRFAVLQAAGGALVQVAHRGGVVAVVLLTGSTVQAGHAALALGVALAATYAVVQAFTVALPRLVEQGGGEATLRRLACAALAVVLPCALLAALLLGEAVPAVFGSGYAGAVDAFVPTLAMVVLAPINALAVQAAALRLRPEATLRSAVAGAVAFAAVALVAVAPLGATGGTAAALAGTTAAAVASIRLLPGAVGWPLAAASLGGAAAVLALAMAVT